ncbi:hypothetical protein [Maricaulis sp.]|uniref:hypothetical protein n=1 Tax=Maricaulis sp. TaxID=1486257 RepID=UPI003A93718F
MVEPHVERLLPTSPQFTVIPMTIGTQFIERGCSRPVSGQAYELAPHFRQDDEG